MSLEDNKTIVRAVIEEAWNKGNIAMLDTLIAADYVDHDNTIPGPDDVPAREHAKQSVAAYRAAFPDLRMSVEAMAGEGDIVVTRWTATGTHNGPLLGVAPTGRRVSVTGMFMDRIAQGQMAESWASWDTLGLLRQLGVAPSSVPV